uniref:Transmembrane p24 trafficking protein 10 n=1 Tax=Latimeria chalumnae TaxID=7897 RepID=H2ZVD8_LATCH
MERLALVLGILSVAFQVFGTDAVSFYLPSQTRKCLKEEIHKDVLVTGEYEVTEHSDTRVDLKVTDSSGHILYSKEDARKGKFAFSTEDFDLYQICFQSSLPEGGKRRLK